MMLTLLTGLAALQHAPDTVTARHLERLLPERRVCVTRAWLEADERRRTRVRELYLERRLDVPTLHGQTPHDLALQLHVLEGMQVQRARLPGQRLVDALDLMVQPGAFEATDGEHGEHLTVRVLPFACPTQLLPEQVELSLLWVGPQGEQIRARREPVHRDALRLPGFDMYLRAPASQPGRWQLIPEAKVHGSSFRGVPVAVDCVAELHERFDRVLPEELAPEDEADWQRALRESLTYGLRHPTAPGIGAWLEQGQHSGWISHSERGEKGAGFPQRQVLEADGTRHSVVVILPERERPAWSLIGPMGDAWRELSKRGVRIVFSNASLRTDAGSAIRELIREESSSGLEVTVVTSGVQVGYLALALRRDRELPLDRLVLSLVLPEDGAPPSSLREGVPMLHLQPLSWDRGVRRDPLVAQNLRVMIPDPPLIAELELPRRLGLWLLGGDAPHKVGEEQDR